MRIYLASAFARQNACRLVMQAPDGMVMEIREATRTDEQNRKLHAMITDIIDQVEDGDQFSIEEWKLRFMNALRNEVRFLPELDGGGSFPVGQKTSELNVSQFSGLVELIYEYGGRKGVRWTDPQERAA